MSMLRLCLKTSMLNKNNIGRFGEFRMIHQRPVEFKRKKQDYNLVSNNFQSQQDEKDKIDAIGYTLLAIPIISFMLGTWQVNRRKWKLNLIEDLSKRMNSPPQELPEDLSQLKNLEYCPIKVRGEFLYDKEFKVGPKSLIVGGAGVTEKGGGGGLITSGGSTGYCIVTPFKLENRDTKILINRGWIRTNGKGNNISETKLAHIPGIHEITGVVRLNEKRSQFMPKNTKGNWAYRDLNAMAEIAQTEPVYLDMIASDGVPGGPIAGQTRVTLRNEHTSYIITWYTLSALTTWMWIRQFIRKLPLL
ncbi:surfeit locus protein 1 [Aphidius gifuensis]|uniref:surfeit locus protein 1 n=1 Tax=Aphidius gifuensis TaxID=684658 RepID=UPI001CDD3661|nr:surfeit locus protein 1 [Aphidius gifuensis]